MKESRVELIKSLDRLRWLEIAKKPRKPERDFADEIICFFCGDEIPGAVKTGKDLTPACDKDECQRLRADIQRFEAAKKQRGINKRKKENKL